MPDVNDLAVVTSLAVAGILGSGLRGLAATVVAQRVRRRTLDNRGNGKRERIYAMAITSADIDNQRFSVDRKGYDVKEVDVFLERVAAEIDDMNAQIADLKRRLYEGADFTQSSAQESETFIDDMYATADYMSIPDSPYQLSQKDWMPNC